MPLRQTVVASGSLLIENSILPPDRPIGRGYSAETQVVLPYHGAFTWQVGRNHRLIDANAILFVTGGEEFLETHPIRDLGHCSAILTPSEAMLEEIAPAPGLLETVAAPMPAPIRLSMHALLFDPGLEPLAREELAVSLLGETLSQQERPAVPARAVVERAKEVLHAHAHEVLSLEFVSNAVGVTPIYLTQTFTRNEGLPLYRYQMRLRLSRALLELPTCRDLTALALDLGFSNHSHFTTKFRETFGITPSQFRSRHAPRSEAGGRMKAGRS
ncbi:MAG TPA: helix-turn-helix transcriptional regulator [Allosphingosinicella sp.]